MVPEPSILVALVLLIDQIPMPPPPPRRRGHPTVYSERLFLKALVIMIVRRLTTVHAFSVLDQDTAEMRQLRTLLMEHGHYPARRTWERRLRAIPETLPAQIGCLGRHLVARREPAAVVQFGREMRGVDETKRMEFDATVMLCAVHFGREVVVHFRPRIDTQDRLPAATLRCAFFLGRHQSARLRDRADVVGPLHRVIDDGAASVARNRRLVPRMEGIRRVDVPEYPDYSVREAIANAGAHRDWSFGGAKVRLFIFDDRLEIWSPGKLPPPVTLERLGYDQFSRHRMIARVLVERGRITAQCTIPGHQ